MTTKTIWIWIVVVILVLAGIWYFVGSSSSSSPTATNSTNGYPSGTTGNTTGQPTGGGNTTPSSGSGSTGTAAPVSQLVGIGSISDLLAMKENLSCSINLSTSKTQRSGSVYVAAGLMRGDFFSTNPGQSTVISMIDNGTSLYAWSNSGNTGLQLPAAASVNGSAIASYGGIDPAVDFHYICHPWAVSAGFFVPPTNVVFSATQH